MDCVLIGMTRSTTDGLPRVFIGTTRFTTDGLRVYRLDLLLMDCVFIGI